MPPIAPLNPADTHAVVVGVGHYGGDGEGSTLGDLDGAAEDALDIANWLVKERRVTPANIQLFLSPTAKNVRVAPAGVEVKSATRENIDWVIETYLKEKAGSLLWFFWAGHGVQQRDGSLRLLYADATAQNKQNLDLNGLIRYLRTDAFSENRWAHQVFIVDACRNFASHERWYFELPTNQFAAGLEAEGRAQFALFAAREGEYAWESPTKDYINSGLLTYELLGLLKEAPTAEWPPDLPKVTNALIARFKQLCEQGEAKQVPSFLSDQDWDRNQRAYRRARDTDAGIPVRTRLTPESRAMLVEALQKIEQFASPALRSDLIAALRVPKVQWAEDAKKHAAVVIDACSEVEWGFAALLDALDARKFAGVAGLAACLDRCCMLSIGKWMDLVALMQFMARGLNLSHDDAADALRRCGGLQAPPSSGHELFFRATAVFAQMVWTGDKSAPPLFAYLEHCREFFPPGGLLDEFDAWEKMRADNLRVELAGIREGVDQFKSERDRPKSEAELETRPGAILCIKIEPRAVVPPGEIAPDVVSGAGAGGCEGHRVTAWLRADWVDAKVTRVACKWVVPASSLPSVLEEIVAEGYSWVESSPDPAQPFRVDVFLPMALLDLPVDKEPLEGRNDTLGEQYQILARSYDRFYDTKRFQAARKTLRQNWSRRKMLVPDEAVAWLCRPEECDLKLGETTLILIGLKLPPRDEQGSRDRLLHGFLQSGLPFGLFLRGSQGTDADTKVVIKDLVLGRPPAQWSANVTDFRRPRSLARLQCDGLMLFWDDPDCVPPDVNYKLKAI